MEPIYIAAIISFVIGVFGYIIFRFWVLPIGRYMQVKSHLTSDLGALLNMLPTERPKNTDISKIQDRQLSLRRHSSDLVSICKDELPHWYRLYLKSKEELPLDAAEVSMRLSNTHKLEHALKQVNEIKGFLRLK